MKTFNTREMFWTNIRGRRAQIQRYLYRLNGTNERNQSFYCLEIRPNCPVGLLHQIKLTVPFASNYDTMILNEGWDFRNIQSNRPDIRDSTAALENTIYQIASWTDTNRLLYDSAVGPVYFESGNKTLKNEKENKLWPSKHKVSGGWDETRAPEPCLALIIEVDTFDWTPVSNDATTISAELLIEGQFPKSYLHSVLR